MKSKIKHASWLGVFLLWLCFAPDTLRAQLDSCGSTSNVLIVNVNPDPEVVVAGGNVIICQQGYITMTATLTGGTSEATFQWEMSTDSASWTDISDADTTIYTTPMLYDTIWYRVRVETGSSGCDVVWSEPVSVKVVDDPVIVASGAGPVCDGGSLSLQAQTTGGTGGCQVFWEKLLPDSITWEAIPAAFGHLYTTPALTQTTSYRAVFVCGGISCDTATSNVQTVVVGGDPSLAILGDRGVCLGGSTTLTASAAGGVGSLTFQWQSSADGENFTDVAGATDSVFTTPPLSDTIFYKILVSAQGAGCSSFDTAQVLVFQSVAVLAGNGSNPYCAGEVINLTATGSGGTEPYTYAWSGQNGFTSVAKNPLIPISTPASSGDYFLTLTDAHGCTARDTVGVTVFANPIATATNDGPYCKDDTLKIYATGGISFSWSGPAGFNSTTQNPIRPNAHPGMRGTYKLTVTDGNGCTATASTEVMVAICKELCNNGLDDDGDGAADCVDTECSVGNFNVAASAGEICAGESAQLTASNGASYLWSNGATSASINVSQSGIYTVTVTNAKGCTLVRNSELKVHETPNAMASTSGLPCIGGSMTFIGSGGENYEWTGPNGLRARRDSFTLTGLDAMMGGIYKLKVSNDFGCADSTTFAIASGQMHAPLEARGGEITCAQPIATLSSANDLTGLPCLWTGPNGYSSSVGKPGVLEPGVYTMTVVDSLTGCVYTDTAQVFKSDTSFALSCEALGKITCLNDSVQLVLQADLPDFHVSWEGPDDFNTHVRMPFAKAVGQYDVVVSSLTTGCQSVCSVTIVEDKNPPTAVAAAGTLTCNTPFIQLFCTASMPGMKFFWTGPGGFASTEQNPIVTQAGVYFVQVVDPNNGCPSTSAEVTVEGGQ